MPLAFGIDPSLTGFGISDGDRHEVFSTDAGSPLWARSSFLTTAVRQYVGEQTAFAEYLGDQLAVMVSPPERHFFIEGPSFGSPRGASHLFEVGWLMCDLDRLARFMGAQVTIVQPSTLRKFVTGKGNAPKETLALRCFKRWGVEIENDRGFNKLEAYCLHRYGLAVLAGEIVHAEIAKRGAGRRKKTA